MLAWRECLLLIEFAQNKIGFSKSPPAVSVDVNREFRRTGKTEAPIVQHTTSKRATAIPKNKNKKAVRHNRIRTAATAPISGSTEAPIVQYTTSHRATAIPENTNKKAVRRNRNQTAATASISGCSEAPIVQHTRSQTVTSSFPEADKDLEVRQTRSRTAVSQAEKFLQQTSRIPETDREPVVRLKRDESKTPAIGKVVRQTRKQTSNILLLHVSIHFISMCDPF